MTRICVSLGDALAELIDHRGKTPKKLGGDWTEYGHRVVSALNVKGSRVDDNDHHYISPELYEKWMKIPLQAGDVLLTSEAPTGEVAYLPECYDWALGQRLFGLRGKPGLLDGRYLFYALRGGDVRNQMIARATGTTVSGIRQSELVKVELDLPPIDEQRAVAGTLGALDDKIESNRRIIEIANQLLDAGADKISLQLHTAPLSALTTVMRTSMNPAELGDVLVDHFSLPSFDEAVWPERVPAASIMSNKVVLGGPSILISRLNPRFNRTWWVAPESGVAALTSTEFSCLSAATRSDLAALWLTVRDRFFREELTHRVTGTSGSHQRIRPDDLLSIEVPDTRQLSDDVKQQALDLLDLIHIRRREVRKLAAIRDVLLPEFLSGRIRVPEAREAVQGVVA